MTVIEYAQHLATMANWTAGKATKNQAYQAWDQFIKGNYAIVAVPTKAEWPSQLRRPPTQEDPNPGPWGTWKHLLAAVSPIGMLGLMIGDEEFREAVFVKVEQGADVAAKGAKAVAGSLFGFLPWVGLGVGAYLYMQNRKRS